VIPLQDQWAVESRREHLHLDGVDPSVTMSVAISATGRGKCAATTKPPKAGQRSAQSAMSSATASPIRSEIGLDLRRQFRGPTQLRGYPFTTLDALAHRVKGIVATASLDSLR
jgi:hypothetical protein